MTISLGFRIASGAGLLFLLFVSAEGPVLRADPYNQCPILDNHDTYSGPCRSRHDDVVRCGSFCFYAVCVKCTAGSHTHPCCSTDDEGNCQSCEHEHIEPPCFDDTAASWSWHLYYPGLGGTSRSSHYDSHNLHDSGGEHDSGSPGHSHVPAQVLEFGMVPEDYVPPIPPCLKEDGALEVLPAPTKPATVPAAQWVKGLNRLNDNNHRHSTGLVVPTPAVASDGSLLEYPREVGLRDLSHLPDTPGEPGAPVIDSATVVQGDDRSVELGVSGWRTGTRQFRYWLYNGLRDRVDGEPFENWPLVSPSEFRVPFEDLSGNTINVADGVRGIVSFQVRSIDSDGVSSGNSNVAYQMVGMEGFHTIGPPWPAGRTGLVMDIPMPTPPVTGTPLPTPRHGSKPPRPAIDRVVQVNDAPGTVEVTLAGSYSHDMEYRWWPHSGFGPTAAFEVWCGAGVRGGSFRISNVEPKTPVVAGSPSGAVYDFQVRLVNSDGVPGDPSEAVTLLVWGGDYPRPTPRLATTVPTPTAAVPPLTVPVPFTTPRAPADC